MESGNTVMGYKSVEVDPRHTCRECDVSLPVGHPDDWCHEHYPYDRSADCSKAAREHDPLGGDGATRPVDPGGVCGAMVAASLELQEGRA